MSPLERRPGVGLVSQARFQELRNESWGKDQRVSELEVGAESCAVVACPRWRRVDFDVNVERLRVVLVWCGYSRVDGLVCNAGRAAADAGRACGEEQVGDGA